MTMYKSLYPGDNVEKLHVTRNGGRVVASIKNYVNESIQR